MAFDAGSIEARAKVDRTQFNADLKAMQDAVRKFQANTIKPRVQLNTAAAKAELDRLKAKLAELERHEYKIRVRVDQDQFRRDTDQIANQARRTGQSASKDLSLIRVALEQGLPPAVALAGGLVAIGAGLVGAGVTGLVAFQGIKTEIKNNTQVGQQYKTGLAAINLEFANTKRIAASGLLDGFNKGVEKARADLPGFNQYIGQSSKVLGDIAQHGIGGLIGGFQTFNPLMLQSEQYLDSLAKRFEGWATGPGGAQFAKTLGTDLQHAIPALEQLVTLVSHLVAAADPIGHVMLDTITKLAAAINSLPTGVLTTLLGTYLAFRTISTVTAIVDRATAALGRLAVAESTAAGAGAGGAAGAAGGAAVLSRTGKVVRGIGIGAILGYLGGNALLGATPSSWDSGGTGVKGGISFATKGLGDLLTGHWGFGDARGALQAQYQAEYQKALAADIQRMADQQIAAQSQNYQNAGYSPTAAYRATWQYPATHMAPQLGMTPAMYRTQQAGLVRGAVGQVQNQIDPATVSKGYDQLTASLNKSITANQKYFDTSGQIHTLHNGLKVSADEYTKAVIANNHSVFIADAVMVARHGTLLDEQDALKKVQTEQHRYNDFLAEAQGRYGLTAQQAGVYAASLGLTAKQITATKDSSGQAAQAIALVSKQLLNGDSATQAWLSTISQLDLSTDSLSNRVTVLGAGLQALQGTTNMQAGANLSAASAAETAANALKANSKSVSDNGNLLGQLVKHGRDWVVEQPKLTAGSLQIQQAFAGAGQSAITLAQQIYQNESATKGNAAAVKDAFGAYEGLRNQFISTAKQMGYSSAAAHKLADQIYGIPDKNFEDSLKVGNLPQALAGITTQLTNLNDNLSNILIKLGIDVQNGAELNDTWNKVFGLQGTHEVVLHYTDNLGNNRGGGGLPNARGGRINVGTGPTADDVHVRASKGEWFINAEQSAKYNKLLGDINYKRNGFAAGGRAGDPPPSLVTSGGGGSGNGDGSGSGSGSGSDPSSPSSTPPKDLTNTKLVSRLQGYASGLGNALATLRQYVNPVSTLSADLSAMYDAIKKANAAGFGNSPLVKQMREEIHALRDTEKQLADDTAARKRWRDQLHQDTQASNSYRRQVRDTFLNQFNAQSGNGYAYGIKASLNQAIKNAAKFKQLRERAEKMGLDPKIIQMYEQAGPDGEKALEAIVGQGKAYIKTIDDKYERLGNLSGDIGRAAAQDRYGADIAKDNKKIADLTEKIHDDNKAARHELKQLTHQVGQIRHEIAHAVDQERKK